VDRKTGKKEDCAPAKHQQSPCCRKIKKINNTAFDHLSANSGRLSKENHHCTKKFSCPLLIAELCYIKFNMDIELK